MSEFSSSAAKALVVYFAITCSIVIAQEVAFLRGDACFVALLKEDSSFVLGGNELRSATHFNAPVFLDGVEGLHSLDVSRLSAKQLSTARTLARKMILDDTKHHSVLMFVCDAGFDFHLWWLGLHYNRNWNHNRVQCQRPTNCLGPMGVASFCLKDVGKVPSLPLAKESESNNKLVPIVLKDCSIAFLREDEASRQNDRTVVDHAGTISHPKFDYNPKKKVGFLPGDAFFLGSLDGADESSLTLRYVFFENQITNLNNKQLPKDQKSSRMRILGLPSSVKREIANIISQFSMKKRTCGIFVVEKTYDPIVLGLGIRGNVTLPGYESGEYDFELSDCLMPFETYSGWGLPRKSLPVEETETEFRVSYNDIKLVVVPTPDSVRYRCFPGEFYFNPWFQISGTNCQTWRASDLLEERILDVSKK